MIEQHLTEHIRTGLDRALAELALDPADVPEVELDRPKRKEFGDFTTNVAMILGSRTGANPRHIAEALVRNLPEDRLVTKAEVAGPGFINFFVAEDWLHDVLREVIALGDDYGKGEPTGQRVQVEFVSANPTGPLHVGHARNAVLGDAIARLLEVSGDEVEREYYYNDAGRQMDLFSLSVQARYLELAARPAEFPEEGYRGEYILEVAEAIRAEHGDALADLPAHERLTAIHDAGVKLMFRWIERTLDRFGVHFDTWFSERKLHDEGEIDAAIARLLETRYAYEAEGATWFRSTAFGDDKDRVLVRSSGAPTYFGADAAYVVDKFSRGFDRLVYVWGADHHGDVARVKGVAQALGYDPERVETFLYQFVSFLRGGQPVKMSKRSGDLLTLDELLDEVGPDAARYTLLTRSHDSPIEFDIVDVTKQSMENPVYYVQYAHARIASILRTAADRGVSTEPLDQANLARLETEPELDLLRKIAELPELVATAAGFRAPHRLTKYAEDLAATFHRFYTEARVLTDDAELTQARLWLATAAKQAVGNVLRLIGVGAPESMERTDRDPEP